MSNAHLPFGNNRHRNTHARLFCIPHAGGGASAYRTWRDVFAPAIDIQPVQLPGRETLLESDLVDDPNQLVDELATALRPELVPPFVLFGHSMGALLASELVAWLYRARLRLPDLLVVSGQTGSLDPVSERTLQLLTLSDEELAQQALDLGGTSSEVLSDPDLRPTIMRVLRNDLRLCARYQPTFQRLPVPLLALGGDGDPHVPVADVYGWRSRSTSGCDVRILPGGHFFIRQHLPEVAELIAGSLGLAGKRPG